MKGIRIKSFISGFVVATLISTSLVAYAGSSASIPIVYDNIKICIDGIFVSPKDANGNAVEPFIYNGTTYLPIRAVGQAFGKTVDWDGKTKTVYIGKINQKENYINNVIMPYEQKYATFLSGNGDDFITMAGVKYTNGFSFGGYELGSASYNLNGQYTKISGTLGHIDNSGDQSRLVSIYADGKLIQTYDIIATELPQKFNIDVTGVLQLRIEVDRRSNVSRVGFADVVIE